MHVCLHSVKTDRKQMESTADGALDPWSCFDGDDDFGDDDEDEYSCNSVNF